jgi:hypothetical protein
MSDAAHARVRRGERMPGLFVIDDRGALRQAIEDLLLIDTCRELEPWSGLVLWLPW